MKIQFKFLFLFFNRFLTLFYYIYNVFNFKLNIKYEYII
jgi:hypothetical protein